MAVDSITSVDLIRRDGEVVTPAIYRYTDIAFERGAGSVLWDFEGRTYLDLAAGIATMNVGHCHPRVVEAIKEQASTLIHAAAHIGYMQPYVELVEFLRSIAPSPLDDGQAILMNSGSEAVESAVKLARMVTGRPMVLAFLGGFHGRPMGALALTASSAGYRRSLGALLGGVEHVPYPTSSCPHGDTGGRADTCCGGWRQQIEGVLGKKLHPDDLAAIVVEPMLGEGGYYVPPDDFLPGLREICDRTGALLITDEVQTGLGRTGRWFASEHWDVVPDILALGKAVGGGLPLGAVLARREVMQAWAPAAHGSTFGGNPVACRAGLESLRIIQEDGLVNRAAILGDRIRDRVRDAALAAVGDVRGLGLMIAIEVVDGDGVVITPAQANHLVKTIGRAGVVITKCGQQLLRIAPPLSITDAEADQAIDIVLDVLRTELPEILEAG